jgi:kynurenine formamidase
LKVIDLTHSVSPDSPNWEGTPNTLNSITLATHDAHGYFARQVAFNEHSSTHIDAPAHMLNGGCTVDKIPAERFVRPLAVIDVTAKVARHSEYAVTVQDIAAYEANHGEIPTGAIVIARTGWASRWSAPDKYRNEKPDGLLHFPAFSLEAAKWLVEKRNLAALGTDTLSIDVGTATEYPVHRYCAPRGVYSLENVANLESVPASGATLVVAPMKLEGGSGSPVRLLALVNE